MNEVLFIDTAGLVSVFNQEDQNHARGKEYWQKLLGNLADYQTIFISDYILDETATCLRSRTNHQTAAKALEKLWALLEHTDDFEVVWIQKETFLQAKSIFDEYSDREYSFTDCTSFSICEERSINNVFTFDTSDFASAGFVSKP